MQPIPLKERQSSILRIVLIYALFGLAWIYASDSVLGWIVTSREVQTKVAIYKGSAYVIVTSLLLYFLIRRFDRMTARSELAARAGEDRFRELFRKVADPVYIADTSGNIIAANDQACRELGYTLEELQRLKVDDIDNGIGFREQFVANLNRLAGNAVTIETSHRRKDGSLFPVELKVSMIELGGEPAVLGVARNISKRKITQDCLAFLAHTVTVSRSGDFFRRLADYLAEALEMECICIDELELDRNNARTVALYVDGEFKGNVTYSLEGTPCGEVLKKHACCFPEGVCGIFPTDTMLQDLRVESYVGTVLWGTNGKRIGLIAVLGRKPLANREIAEEILQLVSVRAAAELERALHEEERLNLENQILHAQKLESLGVLAGGIAHDFNNILTTIVGHADIALMKIHAESPVVENLRCIENAAARATELARQMLAYSGKGKFVVEKLDLNRLLEEMLHLLRVSIAKNVVLRLNPDPRLPSVVADATQMRQIIMNLVINASEAIGEKSGVIAITTGCMDCDSSYLKNVWLNENLTAGPYVFLEVADTGCGMDRETMDRVFDPFFTTKFTGRGLGMAAVLGIVRGHEGAIRIYSEPGKGSSFKVLLPASGLPDELSDQEVQPVDWKGEGCVLLVDDEETVRGTGRILLQELGFSVTTANDGLEALEIFRQGKDIRYVILDLTMPHMDGEQCFRELRRIDPGVKVIMSSGYNEQEVTQRFVGKGLTGFIQKPYRLSALREVLAGIG